MRGELRGPAQQPGFRCGPEWSPKCRPFPGGTQRTQNAQTPDPRGNPRPPATATDDVTVLSLYEAARRMGLHLRSRANYTPTLRKVCADAGIEIRDDPADGTATMRATDFPRLEAATRRHFGRRRIGEGTRPYKGKGDNR